MNNSSAVFICLTNGFSGCFPYDNSSTLSECYIGSSKTIKNLLLTKDMFDISAAPKSGPISDKIIMYDY